MLETCEKSQITYIHFMFAARAATVLCFYCSWHLIWWFQNVYKKVCCIQFIKICINDFLKHGVQYVYNQYIHANETFYCLQWHKSINKATFNTISLDFFFMEICWASRFAFESGLNFKWFWRKFQKVAILKFVFQKIGNLKTSWNFLKTEITNNGE